MAVLTLRRMSSLSAAGQAQKGARSPKFYISSQAGRFDIAPHEQFSTAGQAQKGANLTFQAQMAVLTLPHMNSSSAAGQAQKGAR